MFPANTNGAFLFKKLRVDDKSKKRKKELRALRISFAENSFFFVFLHHSDSSLKRQINPRGVVIIEGERSF